MDRNRCESFKIAYRYLEKHERAAADIGNWLTAANAIGKLIAERQGDAFLADLLMACYREMERGQAPVCSVQ